MLFPIPSCPLPLYPQPKTSPDSRTAIVELCPHEIEMTLLPLKGDETLRGVAWLVEDPEPTWPQLF